MQCIMLRITINPSRDQVHAKGNIECLFVYICLRNLIGIKHTQVLANNKQDGFRNVHSCT